MGDQVLENFQKNLQTLCPGWREARFMVACSGGLDSTALLRLTALSLPAGQVSAAHLNHKLRGEAADRDQQFTRELASELAVEFITESRDVEALARERRRGLEEAARRSRYDFLAQAAEVWAADYVLTAHQADDQAETMLMSLVKGGGAGGLAGIHPRRPLKRGKARGPELLRPLLPFTRAELRRWLEEGGFNWVEDLSNQDDYFLRNALRRDIMPRLLRLNPRLIEALGRTSTILRGEEDFWADHLAGLWTRLVVRESSGRYVIDRRGLAALTPAERRRLVYEVLNQIWLTRPTAGEPLSFAGVEMVLSLLEDGRKVGLDIPGGLRVVLDGDKMYFSLASRFVG